MRMPAIGVAALVLGGCASTRHEAKPEVALQPQATSAEAVVAAAAPPAPKPVLQRYRPADRSVRDIREQSAATAPPLDFGQRLDHSHDQLYAWMQGIVDATDRGLASDNRQVQPVPAAPFRIGLSLETIDRSGGPRLKLEGELEMALQLPNTRSRLRIFITSDDPDESPRGPGQKAYLSAGLRRELLRDVNFDLGIRLDAPPVAFSSIKWSREIPLGGLSFYPLAKVFVESGRGFGASVAATFDHWSGRTLLRSSTYARWIADGDRKDWSQSLVFARAHELIVPDRYGSYLRANDIGRGWGVRLMASGEDSRRVSYYESGMFYRRRTSSRWLYWFVEPLIRWDRQYGWSTDPGIRVGLDALFWDLARPAQRR
ncbi:MAG: hypothetical protein IPH71_11215 [Proteobacteria bacterium]|nr:hypothetical protein [Pseudomonadota bacterium]MCC6633000.1 hypothetical protein [Gammaproteobacteria bacterium]